MAINLISDSDRTKSSRSFSSQDDRRQKPAGRVFTLDELKQIWGNHGEQERRDETKRILNIYSNEWMSQLQAEIKAQYRKENHDKILQKADATINLLRWVALELGGIYDVPAVRTVSDSPGGLEPYEGKGILDDCLAEAAPIAFITRELFLRPLIKSDGSVIVDICTPERVSFVQNNLDPTVMDAIIIDLGQVDLGDRTQQQYEIWTTENWFLVDAGWVPVSRPENPKNLNPYGVIPWIKFNAAYPARGKWHLSDTFALRDATLITGVQKTDHNHLKHLQSHKQLAITSSESNEDEIKTKLRLLIDPASCIHWRGGQLSVLDMQANLREHFETLLMAVSVTLNLYGIRPEAIKGQVDAQSGFALKIKMHKQEQVWAKYRRAWSRCEKALYQVALKVRAYHISVDGIPNAKPLPTGELEIQHGNLGPENNPSEQADLAAKLQAAGWSKRMTWREVFGWDEDKCQQNLLELQEEQSMLSPIGVPFGSPAEDEGNSQTEEEPSLPEPPVEEEVAPDGQ